MKFLQTTSRLLLFISLLLIFSDTVKAQYISAYDKNGNVRSSSDKAAEEARNKQNRVQNNQAAQKNESTYKRTYETAEERKQKVAAKANQLTELSIQIEEEKKVTALRLASFNLKIAKYDNVAPDAGVGSLRRVRLNKKYGYVNTLGDEVISLIYDSAAAYFLDDRAFVKLGRQWGFIDYTGKVVIPIQYDEVSSFINGLAAVKLNGKYGYLDKTGKVMIPLIYEEIKTSSYNLYAAKLKGKWGFIDQSGNTKIEFEFDEIISGFAVPVPKAAVTATSMYGEQSSIPTPRSYVEIVPPTAMVIKNNAKYKINITGAVTGRKTDIVTGAFVKEALQTGSFTDSRDNKVYGTIKIGDQVWMSQNLDVSRFAFGEEIPEVKSEAGWEKAGKKDKPAWSYYNNDPELGKQFGKLYNLAAVNGGLAPTGWHIPSKEEWAKLVRYLGGDTIAAGKMKHPEGWSYGEFNEDACGFAGRPGGKRNAEGKFNFMGNFGEWWGINASQYLFKPTCELWNSQVMHGVGHPSSGLAVRCIKNEPVLSTTGNSIAESPLLNFKSVKKGKKYGFVDESGKMVIEPRYDFAFSFSNGFASVQIDNKYGFIDGTGKAIIPLIYENTAWFFMEDYAGVQLNGKWGFVDTKNNLVVPIIYDEAEYFHEGMARVKLNGKYGFVDKTGKVAVSLKYDFANQFYGGAAKVQIADKMGFVNTTGTEIIPLIYEEAQGFENGKTKVSLNGKILYLDINGNRISQ